MEQNPKLGPVEKVLLWILGLVALGSGVLMVKKNKELKKEKSENADLKVKYIDIESTLAVKNTPLSDLVDKSNLQYRKRLNGKRAPSKDSK